MLRPLKKRERKASLKDDGTKKKPCNCVSGKIVKFGVASTQRAREKQFKIEPQNDVESEARREITNHNTQRELNEEMNHFD